MNDNHSREDAERTEPTAQDALRRVRDLLSPFVADEGHVTISRADAASLVEQVADEMGVSL